MAVGDQPVKRKLENGEQDRKEPEDKGETGLGKVDNGEGVFGLRRALVLSGARSQVVSLWKVDDKATAALMSAFYTRLKAGEDRVEALRQVIDRDLQVALVVLGQAFGGVRHLHTTQACSASGIRAAKWPRGRALQANHTRRMKSSLYGHRFGIPGSFARLARFLGLRRASRRCLRSWLRTCTP